LGRGQVADLVAGAVSLSPKFLNLLMVALLAAARPDLAVAYFDRLAPRPPPAAAGPPPAGGVAGAVAGGGGARGRGGWRRTWRATRR
jgi:hypothetical protein